MTQGAYGYTIFCDDIRQEVGGKISLIGTYQHQMYVHAPFPVTLPKFGMAIHFCLPGSLPTDPINIEVHLPGDPDEQPAFKSELPLETIEAKPLPPDLQSKVFTAAIYVPFAPFTIRQAGIIRVKARYGDEIIRLGSLRVNREPSEASAEA